MSARRICFVTRELHPFTAGGIGRIIYNLIRAETDASVEFHVLAPDACPLASADVEAYFCGRVKFHVTRPPSPGVSPVDEDGVYPSRAAITDSHWHADSLELMLTLKALERQGTRFDHIEFPDYQGWAFCTIQEKALGLAFQNTELVVRLHSTDGMLMHYERRRISGSLVGMYEVERRSLRDADRIIAHLPSIARANADWYGFDEAWMRKVDVRFPPVTVEETPRPSTPKVTRDLAFVTKLQEIKRPDVFIRAAATLMRARPDWSGRAILSCHVVRAEYLEQLRALVPADLCSRFHFNNPALDRATLMQEAIVVVPSAWESLNLAAYEAAGQGAVLVLNGQCLAFGDDSPFRDGENCLKYDGTVEGLVGAMERALAAPPLSPVRFEVAAPYWSERLPVKPPREPAQPKVSVVITNYNLAPWLPETLKSVEASAYPGLEIVIVDDASPNEADRTLLAELEARKDSRLRIIRNPVNRGLPASRNIGVRAASGTYVLPLDADDCIAPAFLSRAVAALENNPEYDVVAATAGLFRTEAERAENRFTGFMSFLGDVPSLGLIANRFSCATALLRRSVFERIRYDESLNSYEDWDLFLRLTHAGHRFLVTNQVQFHYRTREGSMISAMSASRHLELLGRMYDGLPRPLPSSVRLFALLAPIADALAERDDFRAQAESLAQRSAEERARAQSSLAAENQALRDAQRAMQHLIDELSNELDHLVKPELRPVRYEVADAMLTAFKAVPLPGRAQLKDATSNALKLAARLSGGLLPRKRD